MQIINASYREQKLPTIWKMANVSLLPKSEVVTDLTKDFRQISLTTHVSKLAEDFLVVDYVKPVILKVVGSNQYRVIPKSSTSQALIDMIHHWSIGTDGNGTTIRTILFDYRKAFDYIDHQLMIVKLCKLDLPHSVTNWVIDVLMDRHQRIKLADGCFSEWGRCPLVSHRELNWNHGYLL